MSSSPWRTVYQAIRRWYGFHVTGTLKGDATELIRRQLASRKVFSIQIGSNDGSSGDPIHALVRADPRWRGLFVEPVPYLFERLRRSYAGHDGLMFANVAINDGSTQPFYWIDPQARKENPELPDWCDQLGSFREEHIRGVPEIADILLRYRRVTDITGWTFQELLDRHGITHFDLLHIDTEGYDWQVLRQVDLVTYQPQVVLYEHKCLTSEEKALAARHVTPFYNLRDLGSDMFCVRRPAESMVGAVRRDPCVAE